ncbi:MAG: hypothetical protein H6747_07450 [Deltaproteobacteria bacterium]|nr:hypothetical protein [Deltaproteobacteria bacterium]
MAIGRRIQWTWAVVVAGVVLMLPGLVLAQPAPGAAAAQPVRNFVCPIDGTQTQAKGADGRDTTRRYSDLEMPTRAYTNLVVVCPKCGYAMWADDFQRPPSGAVVDYSQRVLSRSARSAHTDPVAAYQHLMNVLHVRRAPLSEQIGAALYYTYVLKRGRPYGGMDPKLERRIVAGRKRVLTLLGKALERDPPRQVRARLEWTYLAGELARLTGDVKSAKAALRGVCEARRDAGYTIGRLACEMADRADRGETWEDYRDGVTDVRGIDAAEKDAERRRAAAAAEREADAKRQTEEKAAAEKAAAANAAAEKAAAERARAAQRNGEAAPAPAPATPSDDPYAPPPPPIAR